MPAANTRYSGASAMGRKVTHSIDDDVVAKALIGTGAKKAPTLARVNPRALATRAQRNSSLVGKGAVGDFGRFAVNDMKQHPYMTAGAGGIGLGMGLKEQRKVNAKRRGQVVKVDRRFDSEARRNQRLGGYAGAAGTAGATSTAFGVRNVMQNRKTLRADLSGLHSTHPEKTMSATKWKALSDDDRNKLLHQHSQHSRSLTGLKNLQSKKPLAISRRGALQLAGGAALIGAGGGLYRHTREQQERWR